METIAENKDNVHETPTKKMSKTLSERIKKGAGKVLDDVKDTLNRPSRRNSDAELFVAATPEKLGVLPHAPATVDGKASVGKRQRSWRALSSTLKNSLRKTFNFGNSAISEAGEDVMKVFGTDLDQLLIQERITLQGKTPSGIPSLVQECIKYLIPNYAQEEGLFRISGMKEDIQTLKGKVDAAAAVASPFHIEAEGELNCHNVSGLLKLYIRELPAPLYPKSVHADLIAAGKLEDEEERTSALQAVAKKLPDTSFALLRTLTCMLHDLLANVEQTKMTSANLSTVWAPNLIWDRDVEVDPTMCLQFSRETNLAIQYTIEVAYQMFPTSESDSKSIMAAEPPKRRSVFDIEPEMVADAQSSAPNKDNQMDVSEMSDIAEVSPRSTGIEAGTPQTPSFDDMMALANTSSRKRPRSIYMAASSSINDELDAMAEAEAAPSAQDASNPTQGRISLRRSKRRSCAITMPEPETETLPPVPKRRKMPSIMPQDDTIHRVQPNAPSVTVPADPATSTTGRKSIRASIRKSLRLESRSNRASVNPTANGAAPEVQLYYYCDTDSSSVALRKLLASLQLIPREIRNAQNDPMSIEESVFFAQTCQDIVVVKKSDKAYTISHKISDLSSSELAALLANPAGEPRSPAIIVGSTYIVGYDKQLKDVMKYYLFKTKKTATPLRV